MRLSRVCYDKAHRCPGWAGGGFKFAKVKLCEDGRLDVWDEKYGRWWRYLRFAKCCECDVRTWPLITRWLDPSWWRWVGWRDLKYWFGDGRHDRRWMRERRKERARVNRSTDTQ